MHGILLESVHDQYAPYNPHIHTKKQCTAAGLQWISFGWNVRACWVRTIRLIARARPLYTSGGSFFAASFRTNFCINDIFGWMVDDG